MYPELFRLDLPVVGEVTITSFGVAMALAFLAGYQAIRVRARQLGRNPEIAGDILLAALIGGMLGAKIYYLLLTWEQTAEDPAAAIFSRSGLVWYGGLIGGTLGVAWVARRRGERFLGVADMVAPALALAHGIGRIGCFLVGDDYGRPTDSWIGVAFPEGYPPTTAGNLRRDFGTAIPDDVPDTALLKVVPTQLFEAAFLFAIFLVLWRLGRDRRPEGWIFGLWLVLAGAERFLIEFLRAKDDRFLGPFTLAQAISLALVLIGAALVRRATRAKEPVSEPAMSHG